MGNSVQFRFNILDETSAIQDISGTHVKFRVNPLDESRSKNQVESTIVFVKLQERIKIEWDWIVERCIICFGQIKSDTKEFIWKCPHCGKVAHYEHVETWIHQKQKCPVCRQPVKI